MPQPARFDAIATSVRTLQQPATRLIGREADIAAVRARFAEGMRLVTLTGPGGVGKTRLALAVAERLSAAGLADVGYVSLAPIADHNLVIPTIARSLRVVEYADQPTFHRLIEHLRDRPMLLVLDNVEHVIEVADSIAELLAACPCLSILATSREPLHLSAEHEYPVMPLPLPDDDHPSVADLTSNDAIRLFVERATAVAPDFTLTEELGPIVSAICYRVGGLPMAIELAAARLKVLSPEELLSHLEPCTGGRPLALLTGGPRDVPARQQTMRDTIQWSYDLLTTDEQRLLRQLSVFAGGWTLEAAAAVATSEFDERNDTDSTDRTTDVQQHLLDLLTSLIDKSLVQRVESPRSASRYGMLEPIRQFALETLADHAGEFAILRRRHALYFASVVDDLNIRIDEQDAVAVIHRIEMEYDNLRAALRWSIEAGEIEAGLRMVGDLCLFWRFSNHNREGLMHADGLLQAPVADRMTIGRAKALWTACWLRLSRGEADRAISLADEARVICEAHGDRAGLAYALYSRGVGYFHHGDEDLAYADWERALPLFQEAGYDAMVARVLAHLGDFMRRRGDLDRALVVVQESLSLARSGRKPVVTALVLGHLALVATSSGNDEWASELFQERLKLYLELGITKGIGETIELLAVQAYRKGLPTRAACLLGVAEMLKERVSNPTPPVIPLIRDLETAKVKDAVYAALHDESLQAAVKRGRSMSVDDAVELALQQASVDDNTASAPPAGLSRRELDVLRLLATGQSNRQIAAALFISVRTVERHIENLYRKLDVHSRADAITTGHRLLD